MKNRLDEGMSDQMKRWRKT